MNKQTFKQLADQGYSRIPVSREIMADLDTPLSVYLKLADNPNAFLLESVEGGDNWGRYSIIGLPVEHTYEVRGFEWRHLHLGQVVESRIVEDPLAEVEKLQASYNVAKLDNLPPFSGGLVGYFGYEIIRYIEPKLANINNPDELDLPDIILLEAHELAVFDNISGKLHLIIHADPNEQHAWEGAQRRLDQLVYRLRNSASPYPLTVGNTQINESDFKSGFDQQAFEQAVETCKDYIRAGDIMQVVISQRLSAPFQARPLDVYRALRSLNPSPYMYFLDFGDFQVVGSSPEILVRKEHNEVTVRPIAGTRPRGKTAAEDKQFERDLLADPKELAEHVMLIDLGRNDVGRVAKTGEVTLTEQMIIERYSHVMHIVSQVKGLVGDDISCMDVIRAVFPAGTLSGAAKVRAMEIIEQLEPVKRNVYAGAVGYLGWWGDMDTAIAIRTAVIKDQQLHVQAGAGIVMDSVPANEWQETMNKGRALFRAVAQATEGL
ncbi:MAG: anthranilate synthase component I [bacterium]